MLLAGLLVAVLSALAWHQADARSDSLGREGSTEQIRVEAVPAGAAFEYAFETLAFADIGGPTQRHVAHMEPDGPGHMQVTFIERWHFRQGPSGKQVCSVAGGSAVDLADQCPPGALVLEAPADADGVVPAMFLSPYGTARVDVAERSPRAAGTEWEPYVTGLGLDPSEVAVVAATGTKTCSEWGYECDDDGPHDWSITRLVDLGSRTMLRERETLGGVVLTDYQVRSIEVRPEAGDGE